MILSGYRVRPDQRVVGTSSDTYGLSSPRFRCVVFGGCVLHLGHFAAFLQHLLFYFVLKGEI